MSRYSWIGFALAAFVAMTAHAQSTVTGRVGATILHGSQTMSSSHFGASQVNLQSGRVSIGLDGSLSVDGKASSVQASQATLVFRGAPRETIAIVLPQRVELRNAEGQVLSAQGFTSTFRSGALDRQGERRIDLGTSFQVASNQRPGTYQGHADILIAYN